jgi:hypothetical protein
MQAVVLTNVLEEAWLNQVIGDCGNPGKLMVERMGHEDGSVEGPVLARHGGHAPSVARWPDRGLVRRARRQASDRPRARRSRSSIAYRRRPFGPGLVQ